MELKDTVNLMLSDDYKQRFKAEYWQTKIRYEKLRNMLVKYDKKELEFKPTCPIVTLRHQIYLLKELLSILEHRANLEKVDLSLED